jgi:hypothetical protein
MPLPTISSYRNRPAGSLPYVTPPFDGDWGDGDNPIRGGFDPDYSPLRSDRSMRPDPETTGGPMTAPPPSPSANPRAMDRLKDMPGDGSMPPPPAPVAPRPSVSAPPPPPDDDAGPEDTSGHPPSAPAGVTGAPPAPKSRAQQIAGQLGDLKAPDMPKPKWYNRLAAGAAGALGGYMQARYPGRVRPETVAAAEQNLMAPGYAQQRAKFEQQRGDLEQQLKDETGIENIEGLREQREATAAYRRGQADDLAERERARADATKQRADATAEKERAAGEERQRRGFEVLTKGLPVVWRKAGDPAPDGWQQVPIAHPDSAGMVAYTPPPMAPVPKELLKYMPGAKEGQMVPRDEFMKATAMLQDEQKKLGIQDNKPEKMDAIRLSIIAAGGDPDNPKTITQSVAREAMKQQKQGSAVQLTPEAVDYWAQFAGTTGQVPSLGMGAAGAAARGQILNRAPQVVGGDVAGNKADYRAGADSLAKITTQRNQIATLEKTAGKNLDVFLQQAKNVTDTGSPIVNKVFRGAQRDLTGDPATAAFDAARVTAFTEISRVLSGSMGGQLSDSARREAESILKGSYTLPQLMRVAQVLRQDMRNRMSSFDDQIGEIRRGIGANGGGRNASTGNPNPNGYVAGHVYGGLTYLGGDPNQKSSWR